MHHHPSSFSAAAALFTCLLRRRRLGVRLIIHLCDPLPQYVLRGVKHPGDATLHANNRAATHAAIRVEHKRTITTTAITKTIQLRRRWRCRRRTKRTVRRCRAWLICKK